jgi:hypothetical protein
MSGQTRTDPARGPDYRVLGQPTVADTLLASRCPGADARFGGSGTVADMFGPSGVAVDSNGRLYATDYGGQRALTWPDVDVLATCQAADGVIGAGELFGPEAVAVDPDSGTVFVADTLSHTVKGYRRNAAGAWARVVRLGAEGEDGVRRCLVFERAGRGFVCLCVPRRGLHAGIAFRSADRRTVGAPGARRPSTTIWPTVDDLVAIERPHAPMHRLRPDTIVEAAADFVAGFPGDVPYVKCNPEPAVLLAVWDGGVRHFDCASAPGRRLDRDRSARRLRRLPADRFQWLRYGLGIRGLRPADAELNARASVAARSLSRGSPASSGKQAT